MHERYGYTNFRIDRAAWPQLGRAAPPDAFGVWRGEIGWYTDEGAIMTVGDGPPPDMDGVIDRTVHALEATARPVEPSPPTMDGIYAHRWFEIDPSDLDEFVELSVGAWPDFESLHDGTQVIGLWRDVEAPSRLLLITRYASLAMWERSRPYNPNPVDGTDAARARFMRRAALTRRTVVRVGRLLRPQQT